MYFLKRELEKAIKKSLGIIKEGLECCQNPYIACSWGKDSIVLLWLVRQVDKDIPVVFKNSNYCFPDTYEIRDKLLKEWDIQNYIELPPAVDYKEIVGLFGLPDINRDHRKQDKIVKMLKKDIRDELKDFDGVFLGIRATESSKRRKMIKSNGAIQRLKSGLVKIMPIAYWSFGLLWQVIEEFQIPMNKIYYKDKIIPREWIRNSGILSTDGAGRGKIQWIKYYYPSIYRKLCRDYPEVKSYV